MPAALTTKVLFTVNAMLVFLEMEFQIVQVNVKKREILIFVFFLLELTLFSNF
jgi:hypothetical protein